MNPIEHEYTTFPGHTLRLERNRSWTAPYRGEWVGTCSCDETVMFYSPSRIDVSGQWEVHLVEQGFQLGQRGQLG